MLPHVPSRLASSSFAIRSTQSPRSKLPPHASSTIDTQHDSIPTRKSRSESRQPRSTLVPLVKRGPSSCRSATGSRSHHTNSIRAVHHTLPAPAQFSNEAEYKAEVQDLRDQVNTLKRKAELSERVFQAFPDTSGELRIQLKECTAENRHLKGEIEALREVSSCEKNSTLELVSSSFFKGK